MKRSMMKKASNKSNQSPVKERSPKKSEKGTKKPAKLTRLQSDWLKALESGEYTQCQNLLSKKTNKWNYCCLGVACEVAIKNGIELPVLIDKEQKTKLYGKEHESSCLPKKVVEALQLNGDIGDFSIEGIDETALSELNDDGKSFKEIASFIRKHKRDIFTNFG